MSKIRSRGFTLIELLVVIAIIGILSAVVLASLNTARSKGNDAAIKSNLDTIRTQGGIFYDTNNSYGTTTGATGTTGCTAANTMFLYDNNIANAIKAADAAAGGTAGTLTYIVCNMGAAASGAPWAVYLKTTNNTSGNNGWCVDSTGQSKASPTVTTATVCP